MNNSTQPFQWPPHDEVCCSPSAAWQWLDAVCEMALGGDDDARAALPVACQHYLDALRQAGVPR